jgi:NADH-quinone oxidoreductase subunit E
MSKSFPVPDVGPAIKKMKEKFPSTPDQLIPLLQFVQSELDFLPIDSMYAIADFLKIPASHVYGVATFYSQFRFTPLGKNRITICRGTACHVRGGAKVIEEVEKRLGVSPGGTTDDLMFSLETVACVGSCALAPVVVVNYKIHGKVTPKIMGQIIEELQGKKPKEKKPEEVKPKKKASADKKKEDKPKKSAKKKPAKKKAVKKAAKKPVKKAVKKKVIKKKPAKKKTARKKVVKKKAVKKTTKKKVAKKNTAKKKTVKKAVKKSVKKKVAKKTVRKPPVKKKAVKKTAKKKKSASRKKR